MGWVGILASERGLLAVTLLHPTEAATRLIPYGEPRSYLWIAEKIGKPGAARAVGQALGKNPLFIIVPCHRVVASDGGLGGFGGGLQMKRRLLSMESLDLISGSVG